MSRLSERKVGQTLLPPNDIPLGQLSHLGASLCVSSLIFLLFDVSSIIDRNSIKLRCETQKILGFEGQNFISKPSSSS